MPSSPTCPDDAELLAAAAGEPMLEEVRSHLDQCLACRERLEQIRAELALLQHRVPADALAPATASAMASGPSVTDGDPHPSSSTRSWPSGAAGSADPEDAGSSAASNGTDGGGPGDEPLPGAIGKYLVVGKFPPTGQADVFRVVHMGLAQDRVLKLARDPVELGGRSEIIKEGKILASLEHPHLVRVYDQNFLDDRPYLVMEYIRGRSLDQLAGEGLVKPRRAALLLAKVAGAVEYVHGHGIVHRDIKPKNILLDEAGEPRLIDFGMARLRHAWSDDPGTKGGTFAFMAPEQARFESPGDQEKVGPRSDVFALGAVLYYLLTGKAPFPGENWRESWDKARRCDFDRTLLGNPKIPRELRRICLKAMAENPSDRYASAGAFQKALKRYLVWPKVLAVAAGLAGLILLGGWGYAMFAPVRERDGSQTSSPPIPIPQPQAPTIALTGDLTIRVWSKNGAGKRGLKIDELGALPLVPGDQVHLEARLNQPAYAYLLWLDGQGKVTLLYPRDDGKYGSRPSSGSARDLVHSPEALDEGHPMNGPSGLETVLLLVARKPLPPGTDLAGLVGTFPTSPMHNPLELAVRGFDEGQPVVTIKIDQNRGIGEVPARIDDALLQLKERLTHQGRFEVIRWVRFAYRGE